MRKRTFWNNLCKMADAFKLDAVDVITTAGLNKNVIEQLQTHIPTVAELQCIVNSLHILAPNEYVSTKILLYGLDDVPEDLKNIKAKDTDGETSYFSPVGATSDIIDTPTVTEVKPAESVPSVDKKETPEKRKYVKHKHKSNKLITSNANDNMIQEFFADLAGYMTKNMGKMIGSFMNESQLGLNEKERELFGIVKNMDPDNIDILITLAKKLA